MNPLATHSHSYRRLLHHAAVPPLGRAKPISRSDRQICRRWLSTQKHDPLRILFCGADDFSIYSLRAVHGLQQQRPQSIASIDVVCRPDKRVGRGLKQIQEVPIKRVAKELQLPLHQIDTFTGWTPSSPVDLVVAVSFGLLVPSRILNASTYGGLNVHPSLLPDLRGPAPIQHALLRDKTHTGISLQTMHPTRFDHGRILAQTPAPGVAIPDQSTPDDMVHLLGSKGADLLSNAIETGLFISPRPIADSSALFKEIKHAPKIMPEDRQIDWSSWPADRLIRYDRVLGKLWDITTYAACLPQKGIKRMTFHGPWCEVPLDSLQVGSSVSDLAGGFPTLSFMDGPKRPRFALRTVDGRAVSPGSATIEGEQKGKALAGLINALGNR